MCWLAYGSGLYCLKIIVAAARRSRATTATVSGGATARGYIIKTVKRRPVGRAQLVAAFMVLYARAFGCWLHCFNNNNILLVRGGGNHYYF